MSKKRQFIAHLSHVLSMITSHDFPPLPTTTPCYKTQVQSHAATNMVIVSNTMRRHKLYFIMSLALLFLFIKSTLEYQTSVANSKSNLLMDNFLLREKRQLEDLENEYPTPSSQEAEEESGFWDKVVKVALRLFNKFIKWLNSS